MKRYIATRELAKEHKPFGLEENKKVAKLGGHAAKVARDDLERNYRQINIKLLTICEFIWYNNFISGAIC